MTAEELVAQARQNRPEGLPPSLAAIDQGPAQTAGRCCRRLIMTRRWRADPRSSAGLSQRCSLRSRTCSGGIELRARCSLRRRYDHLLHLVHVCNAEVILRDLRGGGLRQRVRVRVVECEDQVLKRLIALQPHDLQSE